VVVLVGGVRTLSSVGLRCHAGAWAEESLRGRLPGLRGVAARAPFVETVTAPAEGVHAWVHQSMC
jgi:hypothetical protein